MENCHGGAQNVKQISKLLENLKSRNKNQIYACFRGIIPQPPLKVCRDYASLHNKISRYHDHGLLLQVEQSGLLFRSMCFHAVISIWPLLPCNNLCLWQVDAPCSSSVRCTCHMTTCACCPYISYVMPDLAM